MSDFQNVGPYQIPAQSPSGPAGIVLSQNFSILAINAPTCSELNGAPGSAQNASTGYGVFSRVIDTSVSPSQNYICVACDNSTATWQKMLTDSLFDVPSGVPQLNSSGNLEATVEFRHDTFENVSAAIGPAYTMAISEDPFLAYIYDGDMLGGHPLLTDTNLVGTYQFGTIDDAGTAGGVIKLLGPGSGNLANAPKIVWQGVIPGDPNTLAGSFELGINQDGNLMLFCPGGGLFPLQVSNQNPNVWVIWAQLPAVDPGLTGIMYTQCGYFARADSGPTRANLSGVTLTPNTRYVHTGGAVSCTLPAGARNHKIIIKNAGSGTLTVNRGGADTIFDTAASQTSFTIGVGVGRTIEWDGSAWNTF